MRSRSVLQLIAVLVAACTGSPASAPTPLPLATATSTASPSPTPAATTRGTLASICGTISDFVADGAQNGSFVLNSPARDPLKITIPAGRLGGGGAGGYACVGVLAGVPHPLFDGFFPQGTRGFVERGTVPATNAFPAPTGFVLPQTCAFVAQPVVSADQTEWRVSCGTASNNNARGTLGSALAQQGWTSCGAGLASERWRKNDVTLAVAESSLAAGDYPRIAQLARVGSPCS